MTQPTTRTGEPILVPNPTTRATFGSLVDLEKLREQLIIDEGVKYETYLDPLSLRLWIGHLCREDDPEYDLPLGTKISEEE